MQKPRSNSNHIHGERMTINIQREHPCSIPASITAASPQAREKNFFPTSRPTKKTAGHAGKTMASWARQRQQITDAGTAAGSHDGGRNSDFALPPKSEFRPRWESEVGIPTSVGERSRTSDLGWRGLGRLAPMPGRWRGRVAQCQASTCQSDMLKQ